MLKLVGTDDDLIDGFSTRDKPSRQTIIDLMHELNVSNKSKFAALMISLSTAKSGRVIVIREIAKLGADAKAALPTLKALKTHPEASIREAAANAVEKIKD